MMTVHARLFATLRRQFPDLGFGQAMMVELAKGAPSDQLLEKPRLPEEHAKTIVVNSTVRKEDYRLTQAGEVEILPPVGGG